MESYQEHYDSMRAAIAQRMPGADMELIDRAVEYARDKHKDQKRKDGSPYIIHPLADLCRDRGRDRPGHGRHSGRPAP